MVAALMVGLVGSGIPLGLAEKVTLIFCVLFVFFAEILNSALEQLVDLAIQQWDEKARLAKDAAAAGVLVLSIGTVVIFAALLSHNVETLAVHRREILNHVLLGVPLIVCAAMLMGKKRRPVQADLALFLTAIALLVGTSLQSKSEVFTALTGGLLLVAGAASNKRRREKLYT